MFMSINYSTKDSTITKLSIFENDLTNAFNSQVMDIISTRAFELTNKNKYELTAFDKYCLQMLQSGLKLNNEEFDTLPFLLRVSIVKANVMLLTKDKYL